MVRRDVHRSEITGLGHRFTQSEGMISAAQGATPLLEPDRARRPVEVQTVLKVSSFTSIEPGAGALYPAVALQPLPIDDCLPAIAAAVAARGAAVVEAPPGAGKTTRVPRALLDAVRRAGEIWVLEPRRLPARLAATRVASELGERVGETVGYAVRFDEAGGPNTRLRFMTEGLFMRRMLADAAAARRRGRRARRASRAPRRDRSRARLAAAPARGRPSRSGRGARCRRRWTPIRSRDFLGGDVVRSEGRMFDVAHRAPARARRSAAGRAGRRARCGRVLRDEHGRRRAGVPAGRRRDPARPGGARGRARHRRASPCCRCTARCRSRSRRAPCAPATAARSSCRRTSPSRR